MQSNRNDSPGCFGRLLALTGISPNQTDSKPLPYRVRDDYLSPAEVSFFKVLVSLLGTHYCVQSKVRLADIFFVARPHENRASISRISQRHLDFLVCDSSTMRPLLGIELDDSSHRRGSRQERDHFVDAVFEAAGLPLLRLKAQREYNTREIAVQLAQHLQEESSVSQPIEEKPAGEGESAAPTCPKCGIPMVLRMVSRGEHQGKQFYGCSNYPRCREMKPLN